MLLNYNSLQSQQGWSIVNCSPATSRRPKVPYTYGRQQCHIPCYCIVNLFLVISSLVRNIYFSPLCPENLILYFFLTLCPEHFISEHFYWCNSSLFHYILCLVKTHVNWSTVSSAVLLTVGKLVPVLSFIFDFRIQWYLRLHMLQVTYASGYILR